MAHSENPLVGQLVSHLDFNSKPNDVFSIYRNQCYLFQRFEPDAIQSIELHSGEWDKKGSERKWTFVDGKCGIWMDVVKDIHDETMSITWKLLVGEVPKKWYKNLEVVHQFFEGGSGYAGKATVTLSYEKNDTTISVPEDYMEFLLNMLRAAVNAQVLKQ